MALSPSELENITKSDTDVTFLHQVAAFAKDRSVLRDQILAVLLAGRDTTAATLSWTIYEISHYPEIWQKLRKTILDAVGPDGVPTYDDLKGMTYLTYCINETLRLYPAVPYNIRSCGTSHNSTTLSILLMLIDYSSNDNSYQPSWST